MHTLGGEARAASEMASNRILYRAFISGELPLPPAAAPNYLCSVPTLRIRAYERQQLSPTVLDCAETILTENNIIAKVIKIHSIL